MERVLEPIPAVSVKAGYIFVPAATSMQDPAFRGRCGWHLDSNLKMYWHHYATIGTL